MMVMMVMGSGDVGRDGNDGRWWSWVVVVAATKEVVLSVWVGG